MKMDNPKKARIAKVTVCLVMAVLSETARVARRERCSNAVEAERGVGAIIVNYFVMS